MAEIAQKEAITQQQLAEAEVTYQKTIAQADRSYQAQEYRQAITTYRQALALKSEEAYPRNMIGKAEQALAALEKQQADEAEKQRQEEEKINTLKWQNQDPDHRCISYLFSDLENCTAL